MYIFFPKAVKSVPIELLGIQRCLYFIYLIVFVCLFTDIYIHLHIYLFIYPMIHLTLTVYGSLPQLSHEIVTVHFMSLNYAVAEITEQ